MELKEMLNELKSLFNDQTQEIKGLVERQDNEIKTLGSVTEETKAALKAATDRLNEIRSEMDRLQARIDAIEAEGQRLSGGQNEAKSFGELFVESDEYKAMLSRGATNSDAVNVGSFFERKDVTSATAGALVAPDRRDDVIMAPERKLRIRDLITRTTTNSNAIQYVEETGFNNKAAFKGEGEAFQQSDITYSLKTASVGTIGHYIVVSREMLQDSARLSGLINSRLVYGISLAEEDQFLNGDGQGSNLLGILNNPKINEYSQSEGEPGDTMIDAIRRAVTIVALTGYEPDGIVVNPKDLEKVELTKDANGQYIYINVVDGQTTRLFRLPVVESVAIAEGTALVGSFRVGAEVADREQATIRIAEQHDQNFIKGLVVVLAEQREAFAVNVPEAFVKVVFDGPPAPAEDDEGDGGQGE